MCKFTSDAIVTEGSEVGTVQKVCANPTCPVHHTKAKVQTEDDDGKWKAKQEKQQKEAAMVRGH